MQSYSQDLRDRVLWALDRGERPTAIARRLEISRVWVYRVRDRAQKTGQRSSYQIGGHRRSRGELRPVPVRAVSCSTQAKGALARLAPGMNSAMQTGSRASPFRLKTSEEGRPALAGVKLDADLRRPLCANMSETSRPRTITVGRGKRSHIDEHKQDKHFFRCVCSFGA